MKTKISVRKCPICGHSGFRILHHQNFVVPEGHPLNSGYDVVSCSRCGFVFADTEVRQSDYDNFYRESSKYEDNATSTGGSVAEWDQERLRDTAKAIASVVDDRNARIVDVGCANGGLLNQLKALDYQNVTGIDPSSVCVANTKSLGISAYQGSLFSQLDFLGNFDVVVLSHVLEHLQELGLAISAIRKMLIDEGLCYLEVPNATRYAEHLTSPFQDFNTEHINHFSRIGLRNLLEMNGFSEIAWGEKTILSAPRMPYPALFGFFRQRNADGNGFQLDVDHNIAKTMQSYIRRSNTIMRHMKSQVDRVIRRNKQVIVWGTGQLAMKLLIETKLKDGHVAAFVDANPRNQGRLLSGLPILAPSEIPRLNLEIPIIVSSTIHFDSIARTIREDLGLTNPVVQLEVAGKT